MSAQTTRQDFDVEEILQSLARRPNVQSTLILSRKDGSIIKASGEIAQAQIRREAASTTSHTRNYSTASAQPSSEGDQSEIKGDSNTAQEAHNILTPAQMLASAIYAFVASASALDATVQELEENKQMFEGREDRPDTQARSKGEAAKKEREESVQLLRLRLKKQEIIIFPDPAYLCCVLQALDKHAR